jgi:hypothetical protein
MTEFLSDTYITQLVGLLLSEYSIVTAFSFGALWYLAKKLKIQWLTDLLTWIKKRFGK